MRGSLNIICDTKESQETILRAFCVMYSTQLVAVNRQLGIEAARFSDNVNFTPSNLDFVPTETPKITD